MKSTMITRKRALTEAECPDCNTKGVICEIHNPQVRELDIPKSANPSKEYEMDKTYQDKEGAVNPAKAVLDYVKSKRVSLEQVLNLRGENALATKIVKDLSETVPGAAQINTSMLAGVITKYLIQLNQRRQGEKVMLPLNDSQFLQEIEPILERKQASLEEDKTALFLMPITDLAAGKKAANIAYEWHGSGGSALYEFASNYAQMPQSRYPTLIQEIDHCLDVVSADPEQYDQEDKENLEFLKHFVTKGTHNTEEEPMALNNEQKPTKSAYFDFSDEEKGLDTPEKKDKQKQWDKEDKRLKDEKFKEHGWNGSTTSSLSKKAESGGAAEEEETEEQTSVDSAIVSLLEATKTDWTNLGDPVNPETWPKEVERAILALNDSVVKAIESTQSKLVEGDFYSKNVDEGVESAGGGTGLDDLNLAPAEPSAELPLEETPELPLEEPLVDESNKMSSKKASVDTTSTETKKALKFVQDLQEKIAELFFDYKKTVETANNSALSKSTGEDMVRMKTKLSEVEKVLAKQFEVLSDAEEALEEAKKQQTKKSSKEECKCEDGKCKCEDGKCKCAKKTKPSCSKCGKAFDPAKSDHKVCSSCHESKKKASMFTGLSLAAEE